MKTAKSISKTLGVISVIALTVGLLLAQSTTPVIHAADMKTPQPTVFQLESLQGEPAPEAGFESIAGHLVIAYHYAGAGVWHVYWPEFRIDTIQILELGKVYLLYVDSDCVLQYGGQTYELNGPDWNFIYWYSVVEPKPVIEALLVTKDRYGHCCLKESAWGYKVGRGHMYDIECVVAGSGTGLFYEWSCTDGALSGQGSLVTWTAPDKNSQVTIMVVVRNAAGDMAYKTIRLDVVLCTPHEFPCTS